ncbi:MAG TPA: zinc-binding alcohol dehydrogenase [Armatimonadota bacterium]|jgi:2-desacetyl-2-hydroxyethyl bacteriochlorophyllide A dehydrogenase
MQAKTIIFTGPRQVELQMREVADPGPGEILVETLVSHVSTGTESFCFRGEFEANTSWANWVKYPFTPGYSAVGRVLQVGEGVTNFAVGDRVWRGYNHTQYAVFNATGEGVLKVPDEVSSESAAWGSLNFVAQTGVRRAQLSLGDCAVVIGLGPVGQLAVQFLRISGCRQILAIDTVAARLNLAQAHGATATFEGSAADAKDFVLAHNNGDLADVVFDVTGHWAVLPLALPLARDFGKVMLLGDSPEPTKQHITQDVLARQVMILGTHNAKLSGEAAWWTGDRQVALFHTYLQRGLMQVDDLITHRFRPEQATELYPLLQERRAETLGVLIDWQ